MFLPLLLGRDRELAVSLRIRILDYYNKSAHPSVI